MTGPPSALPAGADVLAQARAAVLAAMMARSADAGWSEALAVVMDVLDVTAMVRARVDPAPVLQLAEVAATLATMLGRREVLILTDGEYAGAAHPELPDDPDPAGA